MSSLKRLFVIPSEEQRCVWMTAGLLSYQLCDQPFDCECCPVDAAMRRRFHSQTDVHLKAAEPVAPSRSSEVKVGLKFSRNHWWARRRDGGLFRLGIEADFAEALTNVKGIVFPSLGQRLQRGQTCIWVVMDGGTLPLEAPFGGSVRATNHELLESPFMTHLRPFDEGWLCELESDETEIEAAGLMNADEIRQRYAGDRTRFIALLAGSVRGKRPSVGPTLADGGEKLQNFADILGASRYFSLVRQSFGWIRR